MAKKPEVVKQADPLEEWFLTYFEVVPGHELVNREVYALHCGLALEALRKLVK